MDDRIEDLEARFVAGEETRAGYVALIGMPNAGKSSLLNRLLGMKLSIVTSAAQTTRERVVGIDTREGIQMVFLDTPGVVKPAYLLHEAMVGIVEDAVADADVVVLVLDGTREPPEFAPEVLGALRSGAHLLVPVLNKADAAPEVRLAELDRWAVENTGRVPLRISATTGEGIEELRSIVASGLPESPFLYPPDDVSTQSLRFFVSELVRETVFEQYAEEIPYSVAVKVEEFREERDPLYIRAQVYVERPSQKGILIGRGGAAIRDLGAAARAKIEAFLERPVYLDLWIKVLPRWRKKPLELRRLGFPVPDRTD